MALDDVLENIRPGFASGQHNKDGEGIPHLRPMNISPSGGIDLSEVRYVQGNHSLRLRRGDVLFNNTNSPVWVGKTALIETDDDLAFSNHMTRLRISSAVDPRFVAKQLHFLCSQGYFRHHCKKHVNQASIATDFLSRCVPIRIPPAAEQRRIVAKIKALQERSRQAREALAEVGPLLEQFRQSVLAAAFRGDLTADWRAAHPNVEPASELLYRIRTERRRHWEHAELAKYEAKGQKPPKNWQNKYEAPEPVDDSELPGLPDRWCWVSLDDLLDEPLANGRSVKDGNGFPVLRLTALKNRLIDLSEHKLGDWNTTNALRFIVQKGDFLVSRGNGSIDLVGRGGLVVDEPHGQVAYPDTLIRVRVTHRFNRNLLALLWDSAIVRQKIELAAHTTAGIHKISQSDLQQIPLPLPPLEEQQAIVLHAIAYLKGIERLSGEASKVLAAFDQLDQAILAKAFRGELVPQDPNDEPASALLARVREQKTQQAEAAKRKQKTPTTQRGNKRGKGSSRLAPQQLTLAEMLLTRK
jgi:type I restriction enzyme S subunit